MREAEGGSIMLISGYIFEDPIPGLLRDFERRHPGVTVRSEPLTWTSDEQHQFFVINLEGASPTFDVNPKLHTQNSQNSQKSVPGAPAGNSVNCVNGFGADAPIPAASLEDHENV